MQSKKLKPISISGTKEAQSAPDRLLYETGHIFSGLGIQLQWKNGVVQLRIKNSNRRGTKAKIEIENLIEYEVKEEKRADE